MCGCRGIRRERQLSYLKGTLRDLQHVAPCEGLKISLPYQQSPQDSRNLAKLAGPLSFNGRQSPQHKSHAQDSATESAALHGLA